MLKRSDQPAGPSERAASGRPARELSALRINLRFLAYLKPRWRRVVAIYVVMFLASGTLLAIPQLVRWIVDHGIARHELGVVWRAVGLLLLLALARAVLAFLMGRWTEIVSQGVAADLRQQMFNRFTVMSVSLISRMESGQLLQRAVQDVERIRFLTGRAVLRVADATVLFLGTLVLLIGMNPVLGVLCLATMPLLAYRGYHYGRRQRPLSTRLQQQLGDLTGLLEQNLRGVRLVKAFAQERNEVKRFDSGNDAWFALAAQQARLTAVNSPLLDLIANFGLVIVIGAGGLFTINGHLTVGELVAFTTYLTQLFAPIRRVGLVIPMLAMAAASGERVAAVLDAPDGVAERPGAPALPPIRGEVSITGVSYRYAANGVNGADAVVTSGDGASADGAPSRAGTGTGNGAASDAGTASGAGADSGADAAFGGATGDAGRWALREVDLDVPAGTIVALLGATGAGKTTLAGLVLRLYDPQAGSVRVDGIDVREVSIASLRSQIGVVMQDPVLFAASIRDNIAFGAPDATDAEVHAAAQAACIHDHVVSLDEGYDTMVGERGVTLSGGQRQRIAIARAILVDPRILVLDDATSSVDAHTEELIHDALRRLLAGRTSFIIAQRLSTLELADVVVVLDDGRITAQGGHDELLAASPTYRAICAEQLQREGTGPHGGTAADGRPLAGSASPGQAP